MPRRTTKHDLDRHLQTKNGYYSYRRAVPKRLHALDSRAPIIKKALGTTDLAQARAQRDLMEKADDELWAAMIAEVNIDPAKLLHKQAVARAVALGFTYRHVSSILSQETGAQIVDRLRALEKTEPGSIDASAVTGAVRPPAVKVSDAFDVYIKEISASEVMGKSANQLRNWKKVKQRAVNNFIAIVGDKPIFEITRDDAKKVYRYWLARIAPEKGKGTHSASSGNRDIGNMRVLFDAYAKHAGVDDIKNPFAGLSFSEKQKQSRPPFSTEWITSKILRKGSLGALNDEARGILLSLIETGCRPSEVANLAPEDIVLSGPVPYINITPRTDPDDPREIKTSSSKRKVPLVGISLAAMKANPKGFPRYRDKEDTLSGTLNKFFKENGLFETPKHKIYSIRHAFEDRMKEAGLDTELRMILMGHSNDRPKYGEGGALEWRRQELLKIVLPFDDGIV